ncbi:hypothetical protein GCM10017691_15590 [Pseudonocardia petroleophila]|uniref:Uncharacterized protein n=1 Tax=Pseudonocardia petroleophila TaxID=37331 RepID=A0A7G7MHV1_9PSEU|nr:hypothetical protein [Pseudonocardia petroleophila]QNG52362.1 hypothetical protein H6H00_30765 [Pseudonocardia petroleophila]
MRPARLSPLQAIRRVLGRDELPEGFPATLEADERVLAVAVLTGGGHLVVTSWGLWIPADDGDVRRVGWHLVSRAAWGNGAIELVEAEEERAGGAVLLVDRPVRRLRLADPGRVPEIVHERVTGSIRSRHHRDLPGGGAWFVQRKVPGRDGTVLQVRPDPGTDPAAARQVAADAAAALGLGS